MDKETERVFKSQILKLFTNRELFSEFLERASRKYSDNPNMRRLLESLSVMFGCKEMMGLENKE